MSHTMKLWKRVMERRLRQETKIFENQFGFMPERSTMEAIFSLRQLMEKYREEKSSYSPHRSRESLQQMPKRFDLVGFKIKGASLEVILTSRLENL